MSTISRCKRRPRRFDMSELPPFPSGIVRPLEASADQAAPRDELEAALEADELLARKVMRLANTSFRALRRPVGSPRQSIALLGAHAVHELAMAAALLRIFDPSRGPALRRLWRHSLCVALASRMLGRRLGVSLAEDLFAVGLFHDIGRFIIHARDADAFDRMAALSRKKGVSFEEAELEIVGERHTVIGEQACRAWGLPELFRICARYHHAPEEAPVKQVSLAQALTAVQIGNWIAHDILDDARDVYSREYQWLSDFERRAPVVQRTEQDVRERLTELAAAWGLNAPVSAA